MFGNEKVEGKFLNYKRIMNCANVVELINAGEYCIKLYVNGRMK
jgi:hypothetical protein